MKEKGFTLFEVLISVSIFLLISGAIFMAVTAGVRTTATLTQHRLHSERLETLLSFLRNVFTNLPPCAEVSFRVRKINNGESVDELNFRKAPGVFLWMNGNSAVISILTSASGSGTLAIKSYPDSLSEDEFLLQKTGWIRLLDGIERVRWRFFDVSSNSFLEEWNFGRPRLVEMTLWITEEDPVTAQFWIPEVQTLQVVEKGIQP